MEIIQNNVIAHEQVQTSREEWTKSLDPSKVFMTVDEAAAYLGMSKSAIYKITSKREIAFYSPGGKKIYFKRSEVDAWIESGRTASDKEILEQITQPIVNPKTKGLW